ncbi:hypothetical protein Q3G72_034736 [Acer saccharum]|nr:hypothetical protein Q3G72_034736 [Acer saccharum]
MVRYNHGGHRGGGPRSKIISGELASSDDVDVAEIRDFVGFVDSPPAIEEEEPPPLCNEFVTDGCNAPPCLL